MTESEAKKAKALDRETTCGRCGGSGKSHYTAKRDSPTEERLLERRYCTQFLTWYAQNIRDRVDGFGNVFWIFKEFSEDELLIWTFEQLLDKFEMNGRDIFWQND